MLDPKTGKITTPNVSRFLAFVENKGVNDFAPLLL